MYEHDIAPELGSTTLGTQTMETDNFTNNTVQETFNNSSHGNVHLYKLIGYCAEVPIAFMAIFGNILVCWAVHHNPRLRSVTNYFIVSLAVADFLVGSLAIPFALTTNARRPKNNFFACLFMNSWVVILTQSSILSLLAIALDRYFAVLSPFKYRRIATARRAAGVIAMTWILAFLIGSPPMLGWNLLSEHPDEEDCIFTKVIDLRYMVYFNFFGFVLPPLLIMLFVYVRIFQAVKEQVVAISRTMVANDDEMARQRSALAVKEGRAAKLLAIVILLFAICWLPIHILNCISVFCGDDTVPYDVLLPAIILSHANSAMNPIIYTLSNRDFRRTFKKLIFKVALCGLIGYKKYDSANEYTGYTYGSHGMHMRNGMRNTPKNSPKHPMEGGTPIPLRKLPLQLQSNGDKTETPTSSAAIPKEISS
ncbi:adenosine receptor A2b-like [Amphiura filiformis]|uniref:adenosine receptor A2b-like n=1 Tax=Amphiura filiformis TaxID=82378 RepID=UPI003B225A87